MPARARGRATTRAENAFVVARDREIGLRRARDERRDDDDDDDKGERLATTRDVERTPRRDDARATTRNANDRATTRARCEGRMRRWAEDDALRRVSGRYCPFEPAPRSTIAVAYSADGKTLASTHGDHTVKLIECATGRMVRTLEGHGRTPWVVRFHPTNSDVLASGSLDNTVIVWDRASGAMTARWDFGKSIASLAFFPGSDILCVTSGHRLYAWKYKKYKFREQVNPDGSAVSAQDAIKVLLRTTRSLRAVHFHPTGAPMILTAEVRDMDADALGPAYTKDVEGGYDQEAGVYCARDDVVETARSRLETELELGTATSGRRRSLNAQGDAMWRDRANAPANVENAPEATRKYVHEMLGLGNRRYATYSMTQMMGRITSAPMRAAHEERNDEGDDARGARRLQPEARAGGMPQQMPQQTAPIVAAASASTMASPDLPCIVKLKLWEFETQLDEDGEIELKPLEELPFVLPQTVLCSEMGAHFSPCGRYIATCQACKPPVPRQDLRFICELRVYSLDSQNFGQVLSARAIKAAQCLTSIQFSPTSAHVLLAYGRRHAALEILMPHGDSFSQVHTILEVFCTENMRLVRIIPSVEDEVNAACFHPIPGQGIAYGTKEGRLRVLLHDSSPKRAEKRLLADAAGDDSPLTVSRRDSHAMDIDE